MKQAILVALLLAGGVAAAQSSDRVQRGDVAVRGDEPVTLPDQAISFESNLSRFSTIIGDTVIVGTTGWDQQHNGSTGRQIGYNVDRAGRWHVVVAWMKLSGVQIPLPRHVVYTRLTENEDSGYLKDPETAVDGSDYRSGYTTLGFSQATGEAIPVFHHAATSEDEFSSIAVRENLFIPGEWNPFEIPPVNDSHHVWPMSVLGADGYLHVVSHHENGTLHVPTQLSYMRYRLGPAGLESATASGRPRLLTLALMNVSADVVTNADGSRVAVGACVDRNRTREERFLGGNGQWNNDVYIWQSVNSGETFLNPVDITQFISPDLNALPDTLFADGDTLRAYTDCSLIYDDDDHLHAAFTVGNFDYLRQIVYYESRIYHWMRDNDGDDAWTMINHQPFAGQPETWGRSTDRPSLYFDHDTGILWCVMEGVDWGPDGTDYSRASNRANTDIFVSASPPGKYNGYLWTKPVNITNSKYLEQGGAPVGESRSETDVSVALGSDGEYLHLFYLLDIDGGCAVQQEGVMTNNPMVYHRVLKSDLLARFDENAEWVVNYPMHLDLRGCWQDPGEWKWEEYGGFYTTNRDTEGPILLTIEALNANLPAAGGIVSGMIHMNNLTGRPLLRTNFWTMLTTPGGQQYGPLLWITVDIQPGVNVQDLPLNQVVPSYAPHGRYFYSLHGGWHPVSIINDSFAFTKLAGGVDEVDGGDLIFDPDDWRAYTSPNFPDPADGIAPEAAEQFILSDAWPNPFNASVEMQLTLPARAFVEAVVYDVTGREVAVLERGLVQAGQRTLRFDGGGMASGVYFALVAVDGQPTSVRKLVLLK